MRLGGLTIERMSAVFSDLHTFAIWGLRDRPALLIGMDVLRCFNAVELDFGHQLVRFHLPAKA
jgi:hypothetical protein